MDRRDDCVHVVAWALCIWAWFGRFGGPRHSAKLTSETNLLQVCFRLGLFGLDKLMNVSKCVKTFEAALDNIIAKNKSKE